MEKILITGVSSGIGAALAEFYLKSGSIVCGLSRNKPYYKWSFHKNFYFLSTDITLSNNVTNSIIELSKLSKIDGFTKVFTNAGIFGEKPNFANNIAISEFMRVMLVNVCGVKLTIDACLSLAKRPEYIIASSSISSIRPRAGMLNYATSKSALNTLIKVYQLENPDVFFLPLGLCNVSTTLSKTVIDVSSEFNDLYLLKSRVKAQKNYIVTPNERAEHIALILNNISKLNLISGEFYEIRELLKIIDFKY